MLRTNLATRPFYNVRAVQSVLMLVAALVVAITVFNAVQFVRLTARERSLGADAATAENEASRLRAQAARLHAQIDPKELEVVAAAAREANAVIDQRAFSWTELFSQLEQTLPENVRVTAVQPHVDRDGRFVVEMHAQGRRVEDIDAFIEALEAQGTFKDVLPPEEHVDDDGLMEAVIRGEYVAQQARPAAADGGAR
jgi:Tfp pilus assembly protein PilN